MYHNGPEESSIGTYLVVDSLLLLQISLWRKSSTCGIVHIHRRISSRFTEVGLLNQKANPSGGEEAANLWALPQGAGGDSGDQWRRRSLGDR